MTIPEKFEAGTRCVSSTNYEPPPLLSPIPEQQIHSITKEVLKLIQYQFERVVIYDPRAFKGCHHSRRSSRQNRPEEKGLQIEYFRIPPISDEQVQEAVRQFSKKKLKFNSILCVESSAMLRYQLVTTYEKRSTSVERIPYKGKLPLSRGRRSPQFQTGSCWDINVNIPSNYRSKTEEIPDSAEIVCCQSCSGKKSVSCNGCYGNGRVMCENCFGDNEECCEDCYGVGSMMCEECEGHRKVPCESCNETGKIKQFTQLTVKWNKKHNDFYTGNFYYLPTYFLKDCLATQVYENAPLSGLINPLTAQECLNYEIVQNSEKLVKEHHRAANRNLQIRKQKHRVCVLPVYKIICERKGKEKEFWIVGTNHQVYYPHTKHSSCNIV